MYKENYKWHFDFVRLALDTGFNFENHKNENSDKTRIYTIDVDRVIKNRDLETVEKLIPYVTQFSLDAEQARILDDTFVKTFRLSQLSVEYLLFCKKYLDNSLIHIKNEKNKLEEENKELKLFVDELKQHVNVLMQEIKEKTVAATFKCTECSKVFSTEEFLSSHKKRRHSFNTNGIENDKLHMEIKELKGRLNSAEQLIQRDQSQIHRDVLVAKESDNKLVDELQQKFENLRIHVESELKLLGTQQHFAEKYEKWVEKLALNSKSVANKQIATELVEKSESTTQTDLEQPVETVFQTITEKPDVQEVIELAQSQISTLGQSLESKVSTSLQKIESQMAEVWKKMNKIEETKRVSSNESITKPPIIKPRSKFTLKKNQSSFEESSSQMSPEILKKNEKKPDEEASKTQISQIAVNPAEKEKVDETDSIIFIKQKPELDKQPLELEKKKFQSNSDVSVHSIKKQEQRIETVQINKSSSEITSSDMESHTEKDEDTSLQDSSGKQSITSLKKLDSDDDLVKHFRKEVEKIIMKRLQDLGVSPDWKGLPTDSFKRALQIVNHQGNLLKKTYPNFVELTATIEKDLIKNVLLKSKSPIRSIPPSPSSSTHSKLSKKKVKQVATSPQIEIKNRKMYDTDSDSSEQIKPQTVKKPLSSATFAAVIEELKTVTNKYDNDSSESERKNNRNEDQTKGVLKNYPSVGSLSKKKVIFDLKSEKENKPLPVHQSAGSTTSVASSVFEQHEIKKKIASKEIEDLSDFDFSSET